MTRERALDILRERGVKAPTIDDHGDTAPRQAVRVEIRSAGVLLVTGRSIRDALRRGGFTNAVGFTALGTSVMLAEENVCTARSLTMARRIANALNSYKPGDRGF